MSEFKKISRWISDIEKTIADMHQERAAAEARIAKKINHLVLDAVVEDSFATPEERVALFARLSRMARILEAEEHTISTLEQVEKEVDSIYGDQSENGSYYFGRKSAGEKERKDMEDLTTYDYGDPSSWDISEDVAFNYEGVQDLIEKKADWSDFSSDDSSLYSFEDDGEFIDNDDLLMHQINIPNDSSFDHDETIDDMDF